MRKEIERMSALAPFPSGITISEVSLRDNLKGYWVTPAGVDEENCAVVLYFHGGAFVSGSAGSHLWFVAELAHRIKGRAFFVEYGLAPEHILPSQTNECVFAYKWLVNSQNISPKRIAMVGDSAGGGLVILSVLALSQQGLAPPAAAVTLSAWTDLVTSPEGRPSYQTNKEKEAMLTKEWLLHQAAHTTGTKLEEYEKRKSPKFSPIYASFEGVKFPSLLMQVGTAEILRDDTVHLAGKVKQAGVDVKLEEYEGLQHNTAMGFALFEEANKALDSIVAFIVSHTSTK
jgi:monoterpene epsilon-lactone hydrolase